MKNQSKAYILALSAVFAWSTVAIAFKMGLRQFNSVQLLWMSSGIAIFVILIILFFRGQIQQLKLPKIKELLNSALLGFLNPFLYYIVLLKAYSILPAQIAQPLNYIWPVVLVILAAPILKQPIRLRNIIALMVSFTGVLLIATQGNLQSFKINEPLGVSLAAGSSIVWALFWLLNVRDKRPELIKLFYNFIFGFLFTTIYLFIFSEIPHFQSQAVLASVYIGIFEMGLTFTLWLMAMQLTETTGKISRFVFLSPFLSLIFIHFILGEQIYYTTYIGIVIIIIGIIIDDIKKKKA